ncbi:lytic transglycosylase domain-containing protein [Microbacterium sp. SS28]|uniref:aggregation-promoting factor C-terminal-like domain-containing protein n=1 Tax=Microbacterium sp. SS28 TaxID=2919948 RepID=UPI001FA9A5C4|nr:lytic transglycosylase domain-containing protein [Microbacterium sp. SS28]
MHPSTSSTPVRRNLRSAERRARRRPGIVVGGVAAGVLTVVGFAGAVPVSFAEAGGTTPTFAFASYTTSPAPAVIEPQPQANATTTAAREAITAAETAVAAAQTVAADIAASGLDVGVADTTVETADLEDAAARLELGIDALPEPMLPDVTDDVTALVSTVGEQVASLRGSLDAAVAAEAQRQAEEKARQEAEARAAAEAAAAAAARPSSSGRSTSYPTAPIPSGNGNGDNSPAGAQAFAYSQFPSRGWGDDQFGCLVALWNKESGWNYQAYNRGSGAFGIPQALPGSKMSSAGADWQSNAATQVMWGLGYIQGRYGTPCGAWGHSQSTGWY